MSSLRLPDFLVIGAMKSGTTTLYQDLRANPDVFLGDKELNGLINGGSRRDYAHVYRAAKTHQLRGDISTCYSMLPQYPQAVLNARKWLSRDLKIVYLVREPISRLISHHRHMCAWHGKGRMARDIERCVRDEPNLLAFSSYAYQLRPWLETYSAEDVSVVRFEDYVANRRREVARLSTILGISPRVDTIQSDRVFNRSECKPTATETWARAISSTAYRNIVRPLLPMTIRDRIRAALLPAAPPAPAPPSASTIAMLIDRLTPEVEALRKLLGHAQPLWNLDEVAACYQSGRRNCA